MRALLAAFVVFVALLQSVPAQARWATPDDAEGATALGDREIEVNADGTSRELVESVMEVLREGGRHLSTFHLSYNTVAEDLKVLEAETINTVDGEEKHFRVEPEFIEDKATASSLNGFDQTNLVAIAFPKVNIGSRLRLKFRESMKQVPLEKQYSARFDFGSNWLTRSRTVHVRSALPLFIVVNDPQKKLEVQSKKDGDRYDVRIRLTHPIYAAAVDEPWPSLSRKQQTWVLVSSSRTFDELGDAIAPRIENVLSAELPPLYEKILGKARVKTNTVDRINTVTSELASEVRYMGDWRAVNGGHVPRALETVAQTKFGDCKDFSAATVAILRKLGLKADLAWVERALQPTPLVEGVGYVGAFNHAIVHAESEGRTWWIDPTNFASFAQGVFEDIAGRPSLVIARGHSHLETIPESLPTDATRLELARISIGRNGDATVDAELAFKGRAAAAYTGVLLRQSREHVDHVIVTSMTDEDRLTSYKIEPYDLSSRVTKDFSIKVRYGENRYSMRTTVGPAVYLDQRIFDHLIHLDTRNRVSDLFLGHPDTTRQTDVLVGMKIVGDHPPECAIESPWMNASRKVRQTARGLEVADVREVKASLISNEELKGKEFAHFQRRLQQCFDRVAVVFTPTGGRGTPRAISSVKD